MNKGKKTYTYILAFLLSAIICIVYTPLLFNSFINYDDQSYVTRNQYVQAGFTYTGVIWAFTTSHAYNWHPVTWISHMLDVQLYGLNPTGHHLTSILFHMANSMLLFILLRRMTGTVWQSLCVAALFVLHPLHVESVAWIAERKDVLSTFFGLLAISTYLDFTKTQRTSKYLLTLLFFILSLMAKPMLVTLPFVLLLLDYWPLGRWSPGHSNLDNAPTKSECHSPGYLIREKIPFFVLAMASIAVTYFVQRKEGAINIQTTLALNIGNAIISYVKYIVKMFWPHPLAVIYPFNPDEINYFNVFGAGLFILVLSYFVILQIKKRPYLACGWLWYLGTLVPVIGFIRIGDHAIADRYAYVPLIGLFILCVWGIHELIEKLHVQKGIVIALSITIFSILSVITFRQETYWRNSFSLFEHAIEVTGHNAPAHKMLGLAYGSLGNLEKATSEGNLSRLLHFQYLVKVRPDDFEVRYMLGNAYRELDKYDEAIQEYLISIELNGNNSRAYNNLGIAYYNKENVVEARKAFIAAVMHDPNNKEAINNLDTIEKMGNQQGNWRKQD
jgi:protein O-mannosyl-transferase